MEPKKALVTGGRGFIGGHVARALAKKQYMVRVIDIADRDHFEGEDDDGIGEIEFVHGDLLDKADCARAVEGVHIVLHFAAKMGGMGVIHAANDSIIYEENHRMTTNIFAAAKDAGVISFFYASSACVYPSAIQSHIDAALRESDTWNGELPAPQGLYGLEKLHSEVLLQRGAPADMNIFIARFHNIFGPHGSWQDGKEKAPAALLRKCLAAKFSATTDIELWGNGSQRRSFCFIEDAVDGVLRLIDSNCHTPVNIGSDYSIDMRDFAYLAAGAVGFHPSTLDVLTLEGKPTGVASRNSDNTFIKEVLDWAPATTLEKGMRLTGLWIEAQMQKLLQPLSLKEQGSMLKRWKTSQMVYFTPRKSSEDIIFAILLPITSRTSDGVSAWNDGCDYFVLMGDDVVLPAEAKAWPVLAHAAFEELSVRRGVPRGFGCVAFTDVSFPGMPTFPIIHRKHMDIFHGQVVPDVFVNQDGDPYLFQLYRRFGCSVMMAPTIRNTLGGSGDARYEKVHATGWTYGTLDEGTHQLEAHLGHDLVETTRKLTLDVIIPCYRVNMAYIDRFLALQSSTTCDVMFIIIVDDPHSPNLTELETMYGHHWNVRIRANKTNQGASASRNRGLSESAAEWILFLDDDVVPAHDILRELEKSIRQHPTAAGFVGSALFPVATSIFTAAVHLAGVTYFWNIAQKLPADDDIPWGVTANLAVRRSRQDRVIFDLSFPKTGGGEDIDYCRKKREFSISHGGAGFVSSPNVVVTHPYWNDGSRSYWRFYMWAKGDGALIKLYPRLVYLDYAPNSAELLVLGVLLPAIFTLVSSVGLVSSMRPIFHGLLSLGSVLLANMFHDMYRHFSRYPDRTFDIETTVTGVAWFLAVCESTFIRMFSELGRLVGMLERREVSFLRRFDWFAGHRAYGNGPKREERRNDVERFSLCILFILLGCYMF
ncbi:glycosyltransferase family 2 protein [Cytidiella melzeri]|nr:glycosyltransferase family 2 protein [Cytidiella melzeri]